MLPIRVKAIIAAIITIIIVVLIWLYTPEENTPETLPKGDNTLYVQSNLAGECRAIITPVLDGVRSPSSEIPCKVQQRSKK